MSGGFVPYHLRVHKAIDRHVFIDLLARVSVFTSLSEHAYISFGGPFLEDFRMVHNQFGLTNLCSIESDDRVWKRQKFNRPISNIRLLKTTAGEFITKYRADSNAIIWLDYASPSDLARQLNEVQALLPKLLQHDIVKVTLNASPHALDSGESSKKDPLERDKQRIATLRDRIGDFLPHSIPTTEMTASGLATLLRSALLRAAKAALVGNPHMEFVPLLAFRYSDEAHQMLTVTGIILDPSERETFVAKTRINRWELSCDETNDPIQIKVPALSTRERLLVDSLLPENESPAILSALGFWCGETAAESKKMLDSYARFFRHHPFFLRAIP